MRSPLWYPPILVYHRVHPETSRETPSITPDELNRQMRILVQRWVPAALPTLVRALGGKGTFPPRGVVVTFDDGTEDAYRYAFPVLARYRIPATVFLIAAQVGRPGSLDPKQMAEMERTGVRFGSHTLGHDYLPSLSAEQAAESLRASKGRIEEALGHAVEFLSYPAGGYTAEVIEAAQKAGYQAACTTNRGYRRFPPDRWALRRVAMHAGAGSSAGMWLRCCGYYGLNRRLRSPC